MKKSDIQDIIDLGYLLIPIGSSKKPMVKWSLPFDWPKSFKAVGLVTGNRSKNMVCIDVDTKYDITGSLMRDLMSRVAELLPEVKTRLVIERTPSGGWHILFTCPEPVRNEKLAHRPVTQEEIEKDTELGIKSPKSKCIIETRGEGGYFLVSPSKGYEFKQGDLSSIPELTDKEAKTIIQICRSMGTYVEPVVDYTPPPVERTSFGNPPWEDYNKRGDIVNLLTSSGWKITSETKERVFFKHPTATSDMSANFHTEHRVMYVFSPNTILPCDRGITPFTVYAYLKHNGDRSEAAKQLRKEGYGSTNENKYEQRYTPIVTKESENVPIESVFEDSEELEKKLTHEISSGITMGLTTGITTLDDYFRFKRATFVVINGYDNIGKSTVIWYLTALSAYIHNWNWVICCKENQSHRIMKKLAEFYISCPLEDAPENDMKRGIEWVKKRFIFIKSELFQSAFDIINSCRQKRDSFAFDGVMIDPYNALRMDMRYSANKHEYNIQVLNALNSFKYETEAGIFLNTHPTTGSARVKSGETQKIPGRHDSDGGLIFASRSDDFLTIHREIDNPATWMESQIHVRRVRDMETGGKPTSPDQPVIIRSANRVTSFLFQHEGKYINPFEKTAAKITGTQFPVEPRIKPSYDDDKIF